MLISRTAVGLKKKNEKKKKKKSGGGWGGGVELKADRSGVADCKQFEPQRKRTEGKKKKKKVSKVC